MNNSLKTFIIVMATALPSQWTTGAFLITTSTRDQIVEMRVNGFPFSLTTGAELENRSIVALPYLLQGPNTVELRLEDLRPFDPETVPFVSFRLEQELEVEQLAKLVATSRQVDRFEDPDTEAVSYTEVYETEFPGSHSQRQSITVEDGYSVLNLDPDAKTLLYQTVASEPPLIRININLAAANLTSLPWLLPGSGLDDAGRSGIRQVVTAIHAALAAKDLTALKAAFQVKNERLAAAFGATREDIEASQENFYGQLFSLSGYSVLPLDTTQLEFKPITEVNLVHVTGPNGGPVITVDSDELVFSLRFYFSQIDGQWLFVE